MFRPATLALLLVLLVAGGQGQVADDPPPPTTASTASPATETTAASTQPSTTVEPVTEPPPAVADQVANLPLDLSTQTCLSMSCALGQMLADGVRTAVNRRTGTTKWTDAVRCVIIPASAFAERSSLKAGVLLQADLLKLLANKDELVCKGELNVATLNYTLNRMVAAGANGDFPQVSGLMVTLDFYEGSASVAGLWAETELLDMQLLSASDQTTRIKVALPCTYARETMQIQGMQDTTVKLQDGLNAVLPADKTDVLVPPVVQPRVRPHVAFPYQWDLCEDWTGMTVAYTLLVLGALVMVGYQGYQFWRFRSTLSYVR